MSQEQKSFQEFIAQYSPEELAELEKQYGPMTEEKLKFLAHFAKAMNKVSEIGTLLKEYETLDQSDGKNK